MKNLNLEQMEAFQGGCEFEGLGATLSGAGLIFGAATALSGIGGGIGLAISAVGFALDMAGC